MGADDIGLPKLQQLVMNEPIQEVILALSASVEGQTTAHVIEQLLTPHVRQISQLAHGIPSGGELEFLDGNTIGSALRNIAALAI
jgi:recombination protein RecR